MENIIQEMTHFPPRVFQELSGPSKEVSIPSMKYSEGSKPKIVNMLIPKGDFRKIFLLRPEKLLNRLNHFRVRSYGGRRAGGLARLDESHEDITLQQVLTN